jgi:hypothetical protein
VGAFWIRVTWGDHRIGPSGLGLVR